MKKILFGLILVGLIISLFIGCGKRENPIRTTYSYRDPWRLERVFSSLQGNKVNDPATREVYIYLPAIYNPNLHTPQLLQQGFSVLYLLHDFGEDYSTFASVYKITQIADRLIDRGEIQPMIIVMPDASSMALATDPLKENVGGTFYVNSSLLGRYEDYITQELPAVIDSNFHTYLNKINEVYVPDPSYRAISGLGMGGYGALRIAMDHSDLFGSVSAMSPYTSFESFFSTEIINQMFEENGIGSSDYSYASYKSLNPWTNEQHLNKPYSQLVFSMAAAFSPHDPSNQDSTHYFTLVDINGTKYGVDLPFDQTRTIPPGSVIWNKWLLNDLKTKLNNAPGIFGDLAIYMDCGNQNTLKLYEGTRAFDQLLSLYGKEHSYVEYAGYPNYPTQQDNFTYDRLVEILKFHSQHFPPPAYRQ